MGDSTRIVNDRMYGYKVIIAKDISSLEALVSLKMSQGWKTTGGIFVDGAGNCLQSMRYSKNTN